MPFFFHPDDLPQRHPSEMSVMVNTLAIGEEEVFRGAFLAVHLSDQTASGPSVLCSLWVDPEGDDDRDPILADSIDDLEDLEDLDEPDASIEWTMVLTPQQARAAAYGLLRLADGLEAMIDAGEYGGRAVPDLPVYRCEPSL